MAAPSVLILYSKDAYEIAKTIKNLLVAKYKEYAIMRYWSPYDPLVNEEKRQEALAQARHFILLLSPSFITTYEQHQEWRDILTKDPDGERGIIIPIYIEPCDCSHILQAKSILNFIGASDNGTLNGQMKQDLYQFFDTIQKKWEEYNNHTAFIENLTKTFEFSTIPFPDAIYFNAPLRNAFFIGQTEHLTKIIDTFRRTRLAQPYSPYKLVLSGPRGSGKTQIALEFAHRLFQNPYKYILWVQGEFGSTDSKQVLDNKIRPLVQNMRVKGKIKENAPDADAEALREWLEKNLEWLIIFDDIDDISLIDDYIPPIGQGHVLVTTCTETFGQVDFHFIEKMSEENAISFLLARIRIGSYQAFGENTLSDRKYAKEIVQALYLFPLAIDQVGEYIASSGISLERFVTNYLINKAFSLSDFLRAARRDRYYPLSLVDSWQKHFLHLRSHYAMAADLLVFCAFFAPEGVYEKIITGGYSFLGPQLSMMADRLSPFSLEGLLKQIRKYSLIERSWAEQMLVVHPFLPIILHDLLTQQEQQEWARRSIQAVAHTLHAYGSVEPGPEEKERWQEQFKACDRLIIQWSLQSSLPDEVRIIQYYKDKWMPKKEGEKGEQPGT